MSVVATLVVGVIVLAVAAANADRSRVLDLGVIPNGPVLALPEGGHACQTPIGLPDDVRRVGVVLGPFTAPRGPVAITVRGGSPGGPALAEATIPSGPLPSGPTEVALDRAVEGGQDIALCVRNEGREALELIGDITNSRGGVAPQARTATQVNEHPTRTTDDLSFRGSTQSGHDLAAYFPDTEPTSLLERIPAAFRHAATFKLAGVGAWTYWLLLVLLLAGAPWLLARALSSTLADDEPPQPDTTASSSAA